MPWKRTHGAGVGSRRVLTTLMAWLMAFPGVLQAQASGAGGAQPTVPGPAGLTAAPVPFGPGEVATYQVKFGVFSVGEGRMEVAGVEEVRGHSSYRLAWAIKGGMPGARVNDRWQSWVDVERLLSHRHIAEISELRYRAYRHWEFFPEEMRWLREDSQEEGELGSAEPLDDIAFVYYVRTLPLQVGDVYTLPRYFRERGNPVVVRVVRKDRITVPAGTFNTVVVQPVIRTRGLFSEGGKAEIHFTDDHRRILVYMKSSLPFGNLSLHLRALEEGTPLKALDLAKMVGPPKGAPGG